MILMKPYASMEIYVYALITWYPSKCNNNKKKYFCFTLKKILGLEFL